MGSKEGTGIELGSGTNETSYLLTFAFKRKRERTSKANMTEMAFISGSRYWVFIVLLSLPQFKSFFHNKTYIHMFICILK